MDVPATSCLMVGDTVVDIITGKKAGAQTVGVLCGFGEKKELERAGADLILDSTADLMDYLLAQLNRHDCKSRLYLIQSVISRSRLVQGRGI